MSIQPLSIDTECCTFRLVHRNSPLSTVPSVNNNGHSVLHHESSQYMQSTLPPDFTDNNHIASPPAIRKERSMSTAVTTVISNKQSAANIRNLSLEWRVTDLDDRQNGILYSEEMDQCNECHDDPPICEIRIPNESSRKRRCSNSQRDGLSATSSQNLSNDGDDDFDSHNDMSDYKTMYFNSERENYTLRGQVQGMQEANRKLKRQLIELQKQIYAHSRNKRHAVFSYSPSQSQSPWSIPVVSYLQQQRKAPIVRVIKEASNRQTHSSITPTSLSTKEQTSGTSKSVSMSVSSEEGNLL
jgi:hypothetical protein